MTASLKSNSKRIVIKLGGASLSSPGILGELALTVKGYRARGYQVVLVHGGGPAINKELTARGITWEFVNGQRRTTPEMIDVIDEVLAGQVNSMVVSALQAGGLNTVGLSGCANSLLLCTQLNQELGLVGQVEAVAPEMILETLAKGLIPVVAPVGRGQNDGVNNDLKFNVNADWAATKIAIALGAAKLIFLTDQNGILDGDRQLVRSATPPVLNEMMKTGVVSGGMCTKVLAMMAALEHGVGEVRVLNAMMSSGSLARTKVGTSLTKTKPRSSKLSRQQKDVMHEHAS